MRVEIVDVGPRDGLQNEEKTLAPEVRAELVSRQREWAGRNFTIVEVNGAGAESTHIWDRRTPLLAAWRDLMRQYRWLFEIGARANGMLGCIVRAGVDDD